MGPKEILGVGAAGPKATSCGKPNGFWSVGSSGVKIEKMLEDYVRSLSRKAKRNALFDGRKKIKTEDIEGY